MTTFLFLCAVIRDPCNPSPCSVNGQCRVVNGAAACYYPECVINQDCARDKACFAQKCKDPCVDACGFNALCQVVNHNPVCSCPAGFMGSARVECKREPQPIECKANKLTHNLRDINYLNLVAPRPECTDNSECSNDKACINQKCRNPCAEYPNSCGNNAECHVRMHRPICSCKDGFTGNAQSVCYQSK
jgi:hypothetical protein